MTKRIDPDILALKRSKEALLKSTSKRMLKANLAYLVDYFVNNPPKDLEAQFKKANSPRGGRG